MATVSLAKQNFATASEDSLVQQIRAEQIAQHTYLAASAYFDRDDVALPGLAKFFHEQAEREGERVQLLIDYCNTRGGVAVIKDIVQPKGDWDSARNAIEVTLAAEKDVNQALLSVTGIATDNRDPEMKHFIKHSFLRDRVEMIAHVAKGLTQLERVNGAGLGLYLLDQDLYNNDGKFRIGELQS